MRDAWCVHTDGDKLFSHATRRQGDGSTFLAANVDVWRMCDPIAADQFEQPDERVRVLQLSFMAACGTPITTGAKNGSYTNPARLERRPTEDPRRSERR